MGKILSSKIALAFFLACLPPVLSAKGGAAGNDFLCSLQDARPESMAGAFIAGASGVEAALTNPAGLYSLKKKQLSLSHFIGLFDQSTESFALAVPFSFAVMAVTGSFNYTSNFIEIDEFGDKQAPVSNYDFLVSFSAAQKLETWLSGGFTFKYFGSFLYAYSKTGWAFDLGIIARIGIVKIGICAQNLGNQTAFISIVDPMPMIIKAGAGITININSASTLNIEACYNSPLSQEEKYFSAGVEYISGSVMAFRAGFRVFEESPFALYAGAGFTYNNYTLNYTLSSFLGTGMSHKISLILNF